MITLWQTVRWDMQHFATFDTTRQESVCVVEGDVIPVRLSPHEAELLTGSSSTLQVIPVTAIMSDANVVAGPQGWKCYGFFKKSFNKISGRSMSEDDMQCAYRDSYTDMCVTHRLLHKYVVY
jgi:hypothetical protein